ncbi:MAG: glycosyltransferase [Rhodobacteraceae bacterium]|nr:glycosyltransferase [Paracoccaceae bacterium]
MPDKAPLLTIIVTSYNVEPYIEACLDSITQQTLTDIEIIVVDDGSTDRSPDIVSRYAAQDARIVPIMLPENTPGGVATAANAGLNRARGTYIGFADGDDLYDLTMFEKLVDAIEADAADLAMCRYELLDDETGVRKMPSEQGSWAGLNEQTYVLDDETTKRFLRFIAVPWRKIYRRDMLEENAIRFPEGDYFFEDNPFHWFSLISAHSLAVVPEVLCWHRVGREGQTMQVADERLFRIFRHHDTIHAWLKARNIEADYRPALLAWALSQTEWISAKTPKSARRQLFDVLNQTLRPYREADYTRSFAESGRGELGRKLATAVRRGNFRNFNRLLDNQPRKPSLIRAGVTSLRTSGVRQTALLTMRYLRSRGFGRTPAFPVDQLAPRRFRRLGRYPFRLR